MWGSFHAALTQVVGPVLLIAVIGYCLGIVRHTDRKPLNDLLLFAAVPALVFDGLARLPPAQASQSLPVFLAMACVIVAQVGVAAWVGTRLGQRREWILVSAFMNAGNFGIPFAELAFGAEGRAYALTTYVAMATLHVTLGFGLSSQRPWPETLALLVRTPLVLAAALGLTIRAWAVPLPALIRLPISMLAQASIPLMLLAMGLTLADLKARDLRFAALATGLRMGLGGVLAWVTAHLFGLTGTALAVVLLTAVMPSAILNVAVAERYGLDSERVAAAVTLSTVVSAVTTPIVIAWLRTLV